MFPCADLGAQGGRQVAVLLQHAAAQLGSWGGDSCSGRQDVLRAADMCRDACWEQLHTGDWKEVRQARLG